MFTYLKDRIWKRIQGWKEKLLSRAGKDTLIKAVAQAIPSYAMSCLDLTKPLGSAGHRRRRKISGTGYPSKQWQAARRKGAWALGYRDLHLFNLAMLAPQARRILQFPDSLGFISTLTIITLFNIYFVLLFLP